MIFGHIVDSAVRESGERYGLYGLRRSLTAEDSDKGNMKSTSGPELNGGHVGIFGRSLHELSLVAECAFPLPLGGSTKDDPSRNNAVKRIVYLDYAKDERLEHAMDAFINALERYLQVERTTVIKLDEEWKKYRVKRGLEFSLGEVSSNVIPLSFFSPVPITDIHA